jgi:ribosomal protein L12E/L44/L45/RPP1/RPP2
VKAVLGTVSARVNDEDLNRVIASLKGKPLHELISNGIKKLGGGATSAPAAKGKESKEAAKKEDKKEDKKEAKKETKKEEPKPAEEEDMGLGGGLFDF